MSKPHPQCWSSYPLLITLKYLLSKALPDITYLLHYVFFTYKEALEKKKMPRPWVVGSPQGAAQFQVQGA